MPQDFGDPRSFVSGNRQPGGISRFIYRFSRRYAECMPINPLPVSLLNRTGICGGAFCRSQSRGTQFWKLCVEPSSAEA
jgi:hypothetical protein